MNYINNIYVFFFLEKESLTTITENKQPYFTSAVNKSDKVIQSQYAHLRYFDNFNILCSLTK